DPGIRARLTASPGLSQFSTPFVASWRQDIPHMPLGAWPHGSAPRRLGSPPGSRSPSPVPDRRLVGTSNYRSSSLGLMQRLSKQGDAARGFLDDAAVLVRQLLPLPNCQRTGSLSVVVQVSSRSDTINRKRFTVFLLTRRRCLPFRDAATRGQLERGDGGTRTPDIVLAKHALSL